MGNLQDCQESEGRMIKSRHIPPKPYHTPEIRPFPFGRVVELADGSQMWTVPGSSIELQPGDQLVRVLLAGEPIEGVLVDFYIT
jgi:hypothetical protein